MKDFTFIKAQNLEEVSRVLFVHRPHACILAGGTDLLVQLHEKNRRWDELEAVVDLHPFQAELSRIEDVGNALRIGALCTHTMIECSSLVRQYFPFLSKACSLVGSPQIRNMGTVGGAICNASPASDPLPPLLAGDAELLIHGYKCERRMRLSDFYDDMGVPRLDAGEFVIAVEVRKLLPSERSSFVKLGRRRALAISRLSVAVVLDFQRDGSIQNAMIVPGCVGRRVKRYQRAERLLCGQKPSRALISKTAAQVSEQMLEENGRRWSSAYKEPALTVLAERALCAAVYDAEDQS